MLFASERVHWVGKSGLDALIANRQQGDNDHHPTGEAYAIVAARLRDFLRDGYDLSVQR